MGSRRWLALLSAVGLVLACAKAATTVSTPVVPTSAASAEPAPWRPLLFEHADTTCGSCAASVTEKGGPCAKQHDACRRDPKCVAWLRCVEGCKVPAGDCPERCAESTAYEPMVAGNEYLFCTCCRTDCLDSCRPVCGRYRSTAVGPIGAGCTMPGFDSAVFSCNHCLDQQFLGGVSTPKGAYATCLQQGMDVLDCVDACPPGAKGCKPACRRDAHGEAAVCGAKYLDEACCGGCASACAKDCAERGVKCP